MENMTTVHHERVKIPCTLEFFDYLPLSIAHSAKIEWAPLMMHKYSEPSRPLIDQSNAWEGGLIRTVHFRERSDGGQR